ncbi:pirin family protein, partial [Streptomyces sp. MCAF7]
MSNTETDAAALRCGALVERDRPTAAPRVDVLSAREVPLGGPRAMRVRRTLPQRERSLIGAWCFADHY